MFTNYSQYHHTEHDLGVKASIHNQKNNRLGVIRSDISHVGSSTSRRVPVVTSKS